MTTSAMLHDKLDRARRDLLDLTARNRLLNTSRSRSRSSRLEIVDERSDQVFRHLVVDHKAMRFQPADGESLAFDNAGPHGAADLDRDENRESAGERPAERHTDDKLQTALAAEPLQKRLLKLYYDARTYEEEQGVNILFLALGFLKWYEDAKSDRERYAPLLLVPVQLDRQSATSRFKLTYTEDDITTNLSLQASLKADFGIELPDVPEAEDLVPSDYFSAVARAVQSQPRWQVLPNDMVLWFFSFSKFLMFRDLDPACWPQDRSLDAHPLVRSLLGEGFAGEPPLFGPEERIDDLIPVADQVHVVDADSSQALVIEEVRRGRNLVVQGPPGTGKSQTIVNLICAAVKEGKTVLFVAEKMAALEVVERRLNNLGLEDLCLELHSNRANKRAVLEQLKKTIGLNKPERKDVAQLCETLTSCRDQLNRHLDVVHSPRHPSGLRPYQVMGELVRLRAAGTRAPTFCFAGALEWTPSDFRSRLNLVRDLAACVAEIGVPRQHPWYGVRLEAVLPTDVDRIISAASNLIGRIERLLEASGQLAELLRVDPPSDLLAVAGIGRLAQRLLAAPAMDRDAIAHEVWSQQRSAIEDLVETGRQCAEQSARLEDVVSEAGRDVDLMATRRALAAHGRSWLRLLYPSYRQAMTTLRGILIDGQPPQSVDEQLAIVDAVIAGQTMRRKLDDEAARRLGRQAFGAYWKNEASDWPALREICDWESESRDARIDSDFRSLLANLGAAIDIQSALGKVRELLKPTDEDLRALCERLKLDVEAALGHRDVRSVPLAAVVARLRAWTETREGISRWINYDRRRREAESLGMGALAEEVDRGETAASEAVARCEVAYYEALMKGIFQQVPELAAFHGTSHEHFIQGFIEADKARIECARFEVAQAHYDQMPHRGARVGEMGLVRLEIEKNRRHLPLRKLLSQAARAIQKIKPVFLMSPISVAQYLAPGAVDFDLLVIDEASQVQPVDALGAVARAKQIVVVGDSKQLPPTRFFSRLLVEDGADDAEDDSVDARDLESILGLCCAQNVPQRMLSWHYRSNHHSLIAVSNHEFYDSRLYVIPSPGEALEGMGLLFEHVADGVFDRGKSATNRAEAKRVAEAVMEHARQYPDKSLGVGTFSVAQRDAILDELEQLRRDDPSLEHFFATGGAEPFFVKNLENIQGDERHVIFISVGYGRDGDGYMAMSFGPLSYEGGERRLNVLITRARDCCRVFSSIRAHDIDLLRARSRGAAALKTFLNYAETRVLDTAAPTHRDHDSEFERQVARALEAHGYQIIPQVGVAGFFIDLTVVDPDCPGRYLLGIECDGANYHRTRSARDRDRIRQAVLENRGWVIHRIWSTDWFQWPEVELRKVFAAIEGAKIAMAARENGSGNPSPSPPAEPSEIRRVEASSDDFDQRNGSPAQPYVVASFRVEARGEIHEMRPDELGRIIARIVEIEGPIHREEIARRVTQLWGLKRTGRRIQQAVGEALDFVARDPEVALEEDFFVPRSRNECPIRDRSDVSSPTLRRPEMLPPAELQEAVRAIVELHFGATCDEVLIETARLLGFRSTSSQLRQRIDEAIQVLSRQGRLTERHGKLYLAEDGSRTAAD